MNKSIPEANNVCALNKSFSTGNRVVSFRTLGLFALSALFLTNIQLAVAGGDDGRNKNEKKEKKGKAFVSINNQLVAVQGALASLQSQIDQLVQRVDTVEQRAVADEEAVATLQGQILALESLISQNLSDITAIENEIVYLQDQNAYLRSLIATNSGDIVALQSEVDANASLVVNLQQAILLVQNNVIDLGTSLQTQVDSNLEMISAIQSEIDAINAGMQLKQNLVNGICPDGSAVTQIMPNGTVICGEFSTSGTGSSGGAVGRFVTVKAYTEVTVGPGGYANVQTPCPSGFLTTGYGWAFGLNWNVNNIGVTNGGVSYLHARNDNTYTTNIFHVVTCGTIM